MPKVNILEQAHSPACILFLHQLVRLVVLARHAVEELPMVTTELQQATRSCRKAATVVTGSGGPPQHMTQAAESEQ